MIAAKSIIQALAITLGLLLTQLPIASVQPSENALTTLDEEQETQGQVSQVQGVESEVEPGVATNTASRSRLTKPADCPPGFRLSHTLSDGTAVCVTEGCPDGIVLVPPVVSEMCVAPDDGCPDTIPATSNICVDPREFHCPDAFIVGSACVDPREFPPVSHTNPAPTPPVTIAPQPPTSALAIFHLSPSSGPVGTLITIHGSGFSPTGNTVVFVPIQGSGQFGPSYSSTLNSHDGKTLQFTVPHDLGCPDMIVATGFAVGGMCVEGFVNPTKSGNYAIFVVNERGLSNSLVFTVTE